MNYLTFSLCFERALDLLVKFGTLVIALHLILANSIMILSWESFIM